MVARRPRGLLLLQRRHEIGEQEDELIGPTLLMASILLECRLALVVDASHAFDEHLPEIIQGLRHLGFDQRRCQRRALGGASRCMRAHPGSEPP